MNHYEMQEVPATTKQVCVKTTCDLCGAEIKDPSWGNKNETELVHRTLHRVGVKREQGTVYPEGGSWTERSYDICPKCFDEKLEPWLQAQGAKPTVSEHDY